MPFKFEKLDVWQLALEYIDLAYEISVLLPRSEDYNLKSQLIRAATSVALNIAEGSTGQTDTEQARFVGLAVRSLLETVACNRIIRRRKLLQNLALLRQADSMAETLAIKLQAFRKSIDPEQKWLREAGEEYSTDSWELIILDE